jgi:acetate---CoA ligase (ADP-forming)
MWFRNFKRNLLAYGYEGSICPVNPRAGVVEGLKCYASLDAVDDAVEAVVVAVAAARCPDAVRAAVGRGVKDIVVVAAGFAEVGQRSGGDQLQDALIEACEPTTRLYGPNCVGFSDFARHLCLIGEPIPYNNRPGCISLISQSGALLATMMSAVIEDGGGIDWCASIGNAAQFGLARAIDHVVARGTSRVIALYTEMLGSDGARLGGALDRAADAGVTVVMIKAGRSELGQKVAYSHTASVAGNDVETDAYLRAHGVVRVDSLEELARVSVLAPMRRREGGPGVAVIGSSGGQAAIAGELATRDRLRLAKLSPETMGVVSAKAAPGSFVENPFDLTGDGGLDKELFAAVYRDADVGFVLAPWSITFPDESVEQAHNRPIVELVVATARDTGTPTVISSLVTVPWTDWIQRVRSENEHVLIVRGIETTIRALSRLFPDVQVPSEQAVFQPARAAPEQFVGEGAGRELLAQLNFPIVEGARCPDIPGAIAVAERVGWPVVVKLDVAGVVHKSRLGLVTVGCRTPADVEAAIERSMNSLKVHGYRSEDICGILVERMAAGAELLLGLHRSGLGSFVTIGAGGVTATAHSVARTYLLPVGEDVLLDAFGELLGLPRTTAGCAAAARAAAGLCAEFAGGALSRFATVEVNPAMISAEACVFADVLLARA